MEGKIIGGKYQIVEGIRRQRFYDVYISRLVDTERRTLIKLLNKELAEPDKTFSKLKPNLAVVASLRHNGILTLLDYGETEGSIYCVEEYFDGALLRDVLDHAESIDAINALSQGIKITDAVAFAHSKGIIHGLLSPESIIVSSDLSLKVGDFYYTAALTNYLNTDKEFQGRDIRYCAPEIIAGDRPTPASDVYSIGVTLYELLTGKPPLDKDAALSQASDKGQGNIKSPRSINRDIPRLLESVIIKCLKQDPDARYKNAGKLLSELHLCRTSLARSLAESRLAKNGYDTGETSRDGSKSLSNLIDMKRKAAQRPVTAINTTGFYSKSTEEKPANEPDEPGEETPDTPDTRKEKKRRVPPGFIAFLISFGLLLALVVFGIKLVVGYLSIDGGGDSVHVPSVMGKSIVEAKALLGNVDLVPVITGSQFSNEIPEGYILQQTPPAGSKVKAGRRIELIFSDGEKRVSIPKVTGLTNEDAKIIIEKAGFKIGDERTEYSERYAEDYIISQIPEAGEERSVGHGISIVVSLGKAPRMIVMPRVTDLPISEARQILRMNDITDVKTVRMETGAGLMNFVVAQSVLEGTRIDPDQSVVLYSAVLPDTTSLIEVKGDVNLRISSKESAQEVLVIVFDQEGSKEIYRKIHKPGEKFKVSVSGYGKTHVKVYIDGFLAKEATL